MFIITSNCRIASEVRREKIPARRASRDVKEEIGEKIGDKIGEKIVERIVRKGGSKRKIVVATRRGEDEEDLHIVS